jgi:hypothetical protein
MTILNILSEKINLLRTTGSNFTILVEGFHTPVTGVFMAQMFPLSMEMNFELQGNISAPLFAVTGKLSMEKVVIDADIHGEYLTSIPFHRKGGFNIFFTAGSDGQSWRLETSILNFQALLWTKKEIQVSGRLFKSDELYSDVILTIPFEQMIRIFKSFGRA